MCVGGLCVTPPTDGGAGKGGSGGAGGKGGAGGGDAGGGGAGGQAIVCLPGVTLASCQDVVDAGVDVSPCDPVCNVGCSDCRDKCSVNTQGALTCLVPTSGPAPGLLGNCALDSSGKDNCAPGQVCISAECPSPRCYQFCKTNMDCPNNASCSRDAGGGHTVCDVPPASPSCDPVAGEDTMCPLGAQGCYLSSNTMHTLCDCPFGSSQGGGLTRLQPCSHSRQCITGLVCYDPAGGGSPECLQVCRLPTDGGPTPSCIGGPQRCSAFPSSSGTNPIYGFCSP